MVNCSLACSDLSLLSVSYVKTVAQPTIIQSAVGVQTSEMIYFLRRQTERTSISSQEKWFVAHQYQTFAKIRNKRTLQC
jgi:hypothetical protein